MAKNCFTFQNFNPGTNFGSPFGMNGWEFLSQSGSYKVDKYGGVNAVTLPKDAKIRLPEATNKITLKVIVMGTETLHIQALDEPNAVGTKIKVPADKQWHKKTLNSKGMATVTFKGSKQAALSTICIEV